MPRIAAVAAGNMLISSSLLSIAMVLLLLLLLNLLIAIRVDYSIPFLHILWPRDFLGSADDVYPAIVIAVIAECYSWRIITLLLTSMPLHIL